MNERPALESRRVRTHPRTVTCVPSGTLPFRIDVIAMRSLLDMTEHYPSSILLSVKVGLISLGCPKNLVDSEVMLGLAQQAGHVITHDADGDEVLVVKTCEFIDAGCLEWWDTIV